MTAAFAAAPPAFAPADQALVDLLDHLARRDYAFTAPTPSTHSLVSERKGRARPGDLRDILGWNLPFREADLPADLGRLLQAAEAVERQADGSWRCRVRVASLDGRLHVHSALGEDPHAVFLGPDSYRFVRLLKSVLGRDARFGRAVDIGAGAGVGALALAAAAPGAEVFAADINPEALRFAAINASHAGLNLDLAEGAGLDPVAGVFDLIVTNPPYIAGSGGRVYRDGGGALGAELSLKWTADAVDRLAPGGRMILYTGSAIVDGRDGVREALETLAVERKLDLSYEEIDPDVFGSTLRQSAYREAERIAVIGAVLTAPV